MRADRTRMDRVGEETTWRGAIDSCFYGGCPSIPSVRFGLDRFTESESESESSGRQMHHQPTPPTSPPPSNWSSALTR
jgi:hypothetical protein